MTDKTDSPVRQNLTTTSASTEDHLTTTLDHRTIISQPQNRLTTSLVPHTKSNPPQRQLRSPRNHLKTASPPNHVHLKTKSP
jgi:hypothetical protein